ncbi:ImmA/IrrE family metallo-endopeptidase [Parafrigoribacterium mesophilum]|uniref:ImmA/IrrE family metallo-endopeptidase n=1 Tax=Parafrigoribacterium mesophilum TaxID=433646 RepID=UPI0031FCAD5B
MESMQAASRALHELAVDQTKPIDVFAAIAKSGAWLTFVDGGLMLGATSREGVGGIRINSARPVEMQRFTAAHELGHLYLHNGVLDWDGFDQVAGSAQTPREHTAQFFASHFLMPRKLVNSVLHRNGHVRNTPVSPQLAYLASRDLRVSYEALVVQLDNLDIITSAQCRRLRDLELKSIKKNFADGWSAEDSRAHIWIPDVAGLGTISVALHDEIIITVTEDRGSGHKFRITEAERPATSRLADEGPPVILVHDDYDEMTGRRRIILRATAIGRWSQQLILNGSDKHLDIAGIVRKSPAEVHSSFLARMPSPTDRQQRASLEAGRSYQSAGVADGDTAISRGAPVWTACSSK